MRFLSLLIFLSVLSVCRGQLRTADSLIGVAEKEMNSTSQAELYLEISEAYKAEGNYPDANHFAKKALLLFQESNERKNIAHTKETLGNIYVEINDYSTALKYYLEAFEYYEKAKLNDDVARTSSEIASLYFSMDQFDKAFDYLFKVKRINKLNAFDENDITRNHFMLGIAYGSTGKLDSAIYYFNLCKDYYQETNNTIQLAGLYNNIGAIYSKQDSNQLALAQYENALSLFREVKNERGIGVSLGNIAYVQQKENDFESAISNYNIAIAIFDSLGAINYLSTNYSNLSSLYEDKGDFKNALFYNQRFMELEDSIKNGEVLQSIADLEKKFAIKKKDQELQLVESQNAAERNRQYLIITLISLVVVILIFATVYLRSRLNQTRLAQELSQKKQEQLESEIKFKNTELEHFALKVVEKNEFLSNLKKELAKIEVEDKTAEIKSIQANINQNINIDQDRKELENQIDAVHQQFLHKLKSNYPDLTKADTRLCSLLMLELTSKEMASILNIEPESVKKGRNRLRKKLAISPEISFKEFFESLS